MKIKLLLVFNILLGVFASSQRIILKDVNIIPINENKVIEGKSILIDKSKIVQIDKFKNLKKQKSDRIINLKGKFIMPGLADMHVHLPEMKSVDTLLMSNIAAGVTQIRIMNSKLSQTDLRSKIQNSPNYITPNIHYSYVFTSKNTAKQVDSIISVVKKNRLSFIKVLSAASEPIFDSLMKKANQNNITVSGHYPSKVNFKKVLESNYKSIEHLAGYANAENYENLDKYIELTKRNNLYNCPTLDYYFSVFNYEYPTGYQDRLTYRSAPEKYIVKWNNSLKEKLTKIGEGKFLEAGKKYMDTFEKQKHVLKKLYENDCLLLVGSDSELNYQMPGFSMYDEVNEWSKIGIDNYYILKSATLNAAKFFSEENQWGTVEVGKNADLIILTKNPLDDIKNIETVETTIKAGQVFNKKELLQKL